MNLMTRLKALVLLLVSSVALSGCDFNVYEMPLPGGTDVGEDPIEVTVMFADVLDLVPKSTVKVNDVSVGMVKDVNLKGYVAEVTLELRNDVSLPENSVAELRQTSLLGEKFVSLGPPEDQQPTGTLESGEIIPLDRTGRNPEVEEVLGALSLLLNGGGVGQLQTINRELNLALEGREDSAKSAFRQIEQLMGQLDTHKGDIVNAIEALNRLALSTKDQLGSIDAALEELPSALTTIDQQRADLVKMLQAINRLGDVGVRVIKASKDATIESFRQLSPLLTELANTGDNFAKAFHVFLTYPFVDEVVGRDPQVARNLHMGDYTNLSVIIDAKLQDDGAEQPNPTASVTDAVCTTFKELKNQFPNDTPLQQLLDEDLCERAADKLERCIKNPDLDMCEGLPRLALEEITDLLESGGAPGGDDPLGDIIDNLPGGLNRPGYGPTDDFGARGPTMGQLMGLYDRDLVSLLVPGMVVDR